MYVSKNHVLGTRVFYTLDLTDIAMLSRIDNWKDMQVMTTVKKDILSEVIIDNWMDLVSHPYSLVLDIKKLYHLSKIFWKTRVRDLAQQYKDPFKTYLGNTLWEIEYS